MRSEYLASMRRFLFQDYLSPLVSAPILKLKHRILNKSRINSTKSTPGRSLGVFSFDLILIILVVERSHLSNQRKIRHPTTCKTPQNPDSFSDPA